jgi:ATP-dependent RNA helicase DeaD
MIILDEADRMLDMGFLDDIRTILKEAPPERQTVFFSATMPRPIQDLIKTFTRNPVQVTIAAAALTVPNIEQVYYEVDRRNKIDVLCRLIDLQDIKFGIIFCATKLMVDELTEHLKARGYQADKMHGDMTQGMREKVIGKFREKRLEFLVATDVAARGLDVDEIEVVFNYDLPQDGEDYVHRIGRTGRAGRSGRAITFVAGREIYKMENIMRFTKGRIRREKVPTAEEVEAKRSNVFFETLRETLEQKSYERHDELVDRLLEHGHNPTDIASALIHLFTAPTTPEPAPAPTREERPRYDREERGGRQDRYERPERRDSRERGPRPDFEDRAPHEQGPKRDPMVREEGMTRLTLGAGRDHKVQPGDIVGLIIGITKLPKETVGAIRLATKQSFVDVKDEHAETVLKRINGVDFKGRKLWAKRTV